MVSIEARALGRKRPLVPQWSIPLPAAPKGRDQLTLRDLIEAVVRGEVAAFEERRQARVFVQALSAEAIQDAAARGRVDMGGKDDVGAAADPDVAVETALQAFEDGMYLVILGEEECRDLDALIDVADDTRVTFLRLTFLAGG